MSPEEIKEWDEILDRVDAELQAKRREEERFQAQLREAFGDNMVDLTPGAEEAWEKQKQLQAQNHRTSHRTK